MDIKHVKKVILDFVENHLMTVPPEPAPASAPTSKPQPKPQPKPSTATDAKPSEKGGFFSDMAAIFAELPDKQRLMIEQRIGMQGEPQTLQQLGDQQGVSRERIRQLENRVKLFVLDHPSEISKISEARLQQVLQGYTHAPLSLKVLVQNDPWFESVASSEAAHRLFDYVLRSLFSSPRNLLQIGETHYIAEEFSLNKWNEIVVKGRKLVRSKVANFDILTPRMGKLALQGELQQLLPAEARARWGDVLAQEVFNQALFADIGEAEPVLVAWGQSADARVALLLEQAPAPIHYTDLPALIQEEFGMRVSPVMGQNILSKYGLLYGRGLYGSVRHFPLSTEQAREVVVEMERVVRQDSADRQWHCKEFLTHLQTQGDANPELNQYTLNNALILHTGELDNLGRFIWCKRKSEGKGDTHRIDIFEATEAVLQERGVPMSNGELRKAVQAMRGLSGYFELQPKGRLVRTARGVWGLVDRDVPLSTEQIDQFAAEFTRQYGNAWQTVAPADLLKIAKQVLDVEQLDDRINSFLLTSLLQRSIG